ncbi:MAG TPA: tetratricopeptide repeat protein [Pirellulales bacterium]|nr:tetratricopeptide repeat protein [Pirellulales bacterium]
MLLAIGAIYAQTLGFGFLEFDDDTFVYNNPHVTAGLTGEGVRWAFAEGPLGEWYPLAPLSHMLDCQLFGLEAWGHHLTSVLVHAATSIALFLVWWRYTGELWPSAFVAGVFAVHPQHVESVAWVAERKDVLSGLFFVLTLGAYLGYVRRGQSAWRYLLVLVLFALGLMSKPMIVTLPAVLLLLDYWPLGRVASGEAERGAASLRWLVLEKLPLVALAAADGWITVRTHAPVDSLVLPWPTRIENGLVAFARYAGQFFYPVDLAAFYPLPPAGPSPAQVAGAGTALVLLTAAAVLGRQRHPYGLVGWCWYLVMLAPVLGVIKLGELAMADRYMYLPSIGLSVAVTWGVARWGANRPAARELIGGGAAIALVLLAGCAARQTAFWHDDETLWRHALAVTRDNAKAEAELARLCAEQGRDVEAIAGYRRVLELEPETCAWHVNLAAVLTHAGRSDEAVAELRRALAIDPKAVDGYVSIGRLLILNAKPDAAQVPLARAVELVPRSAEVRADLGLALARAGKPDEAIAAYEAALALDPDFVPAHVRLADALATVNRTAEAIGHYRRALELEPQNPRARTELDRLPGAERGQESSP